MMKKIIIFLFCICIISMFLNSKETYVIPKESIRFRIVANSNSVEDQVMKIDIKTKLLPVINEITSANSIEEVRGNIANQIHNINNIVSTYTAVYNVAYGQNYFPPKIYKGVEYSSGNYESLVITLGSGKGKNWWCVMFPPLCLLEANANNIDDVEYDYYLKRIINKYF